MNINDVASPEAVKGDRLHLIFSRQRELMEKYHHIEAANGLLQTEDIPVNLHDPKGQARLKDFAWRLTEELAEAADALSHSLENPNYLDHAKEEMADAFHFLVEMAILSGIAPTDILVMVDPGDGNGSDNLEALWAPYQLIRKTFPTALYRLITELGMVCHTLKNKPWKVTQMLTDETLYRRRLAGVFYRFVETCTALGITADDMFDLYFRKSEVNKFRQRSQY